MRTLLIPIFMTPAIAVSAGASGAETPPQTTPVGVTLVEVVRELAVSQPQILWVRLGDEKGHTLLAYEGDEPGVTNCLGVCAEEFPPLLAPRDAKAFGDWSLVQRPDGSMQWAYQSRPLYTWVAEKLPGEVATNVGLAETAEAKLAETALEAGDLMPPEGWEVARFTPGLSPSLVKRPDSVDVRLVNSLQAVTLTNAEGFTLYAFNGDVWEDDQGCFVASCEGRWVPLAAPAVATQIGDFTAVTRKDGSRQWVYKGRPLYTYSGDKLPGDALGVGEDEGWSPAIVTQNFRPENVGVTFLEGYGAALTGNGMTLYGGYPFEKRWGGRNLRDTFRYAYLKGKLLGPAACVDDTCLETWRPFLAPDDAKPSGYWEVVERVDGTKQWAYKGYALYTYVGDQSPGDHYGQATYEFEFQGEQSNLERVMYLHELANSALPRPVTGGGIGIYWNIAKP